MVKSNISFDEKPPYILFYLYTNHFSLKYHIRNTNKDYDIKGIIVRNMTTVTYES